MKFSLEQSINILRRTPEVLQHLLDGLPDQWLHNTEGKNTWSPYEVVGHLIHGEKTDWVVRTKTILSHQKNKTFEPFDRFAQKTQAKRSIEQLLEEFRQLRQENLKLIESFQIGEVELLKTGIHPELGEVTLAHLLSSWVVHDLGHISQITRVMAKQYGSEVGPWTAYLKILDK